MNDRTSSIEQAVNNESKPKLKHLLYMWLFTFKATKVVSLVYLTLVIALAFLRPTAALIWEKYVTELQDISLHQHVISAIILVIAYFFIDYITNIINQYTYGWEDIERLDVVHANRMSEYMQAKMFTKLATVSPEFFEVSKINDNVAQTFEFVGKNWSGANTEIMRSGFQIIGKAVSVISIAATLYIFNPWLCLIILIAPLPGVWFIFTYNKMQFKFKKEHTEVQRKMNYFQGLMIGTTGKELLTLGLHEFIYSKWKKLADEYTLAEKKHMRHRTLLGFVDNVIASTAIIAGNIFAIILMVTARITLGALAAVMQLTSSLSSDVMTLLRAIITFVSKKNEAAQFYDLMNLPEQDNGLNNEMGMKNCVVSTVNLRYRYPLTDKYVVDDVTININNGEKVALVGENGAGKTTFVKLVTKMLMPSDGELQTLSNIELSTVMQDSSRYTTFTVGDNVFFGDSIIPRSEPSIDAALEFSGFAGVDKNALLGKDIGGTDISGGQWQKLAIARAVYRNRDFIILDEPTGNLDPLAEAEVFKKYIEMAKDKTVLFVTHRISAAALADRIIVFLNGKIIEDGTHNDLLKSNGEYAKLYNEQSKWYTS